MATVLCLSRIAEASTEVSPIRLTLEMLVRFAAPILSTLVDVLNGYAVFRQTKALASMVGAWQNTIMGRI